MVVDLLARAGSATPERPFLFTPSSALTRQELDRAVDVRSEALREDGARPDAVHPVTVAPDLDGLLSLLGLWRIGATPAPLSPRLTDGERETAVRALEGVEPGAQVILWTSGTSGSPRGVALSFDNLEASARAAGNRLALDAGDVWLASLSPAHVGGLALLTRALLLGSRLVLWGAFDADQASRLMDGTAGGEPEPPPLTHMSVVPVQLRRLLDAREDRRPPRAFRCLLVGGAHAPADLVSRALDAGWPLALTYGMTEMASQVATAAPELVREKTGVVGPPLDDVEIRIDDGGEILARGPTQALGYVAGPGALADEEGWYRTGDLGYLDEDGDLWITGRRSDRIVSGGTTVDAGEVEEALRAHPSVVDACAVGLPDDEWGEVVGAWVVPVEGEFDLDEVDGWIRERLSSAKRPRRWVVERVVPRNVNGKPDRFLIRQMMEEQG